jgi:NAD(P)-dependent dehydrogenase (short-subunit alcohol dehydrogenase family)
MIRFDENDRFLVTGASAGIGEAVARTFVLLGARVVATARREQLLRELAASVDEPDRIEIAPRDLSTDSEGLPRWMEKLAKTGGAFRGVVHAAGFVELVPLRVFSVAGALPLLTVNTLTLFGLARGLVRDGVRLPGASLTAISSGSSLRGLPGAANYSASKGAVNAAVRSLAVELASSDVRVNAVLPGVVDTPMTRAESVAPTIGPLVAQQVLDGAIRPDDVAWSCAFLACHAARFITGQHIVVDGGASIRVRAPHAADGRALACEGR